MLNVRPFGRDEASATESSIHTPRVSAVMTLDSVVHADTSKMKLLGTRFYGIIDAEYDTAPRISRGSG